MPKIRRCRGFGILAALLPAAVPVAAQDGAVAGRLTVVDRGDRPAGDVSQAVVWLTGAAAPAGDSQAVEMATEGKQFLPRLVVVAGGSSVAFPNHDPFNHNVFSLSPEGQFDLGLYGRGEARGTRFERPGIIRVYCNVHAQMRGIVVVVPSRLVTRPGADGGFRLDSVPPGDYTVHAWHERAGETTQRLRVGAGRTASLGLTLDARGFRLVQHRDKEGKSYSDRSRRY